MFDADYRDGICDHGEHAVVVRVDLVRDVAVDEDVAWARGSHDAFWDARVRASEPEDLPVCIRMSILCYTKRKDSVSPAEPSSSSSEGHVVGRSPAGP